MSNPNTEFFAKAERSLFRLETLEQYLGSSDPAFEHFAATGELIPLEQRPTKIAWMDAVRDAVAAGKQLSRVHVVHVPLSAYNAYEIAAYHENQQAGEVIRIAVREEHPELAQLTSDFWWADEALVIDMAYDEDGRFLRMEESRDPEQVARARAQRDLAWSLSVPLDEFVAAVGSQPTR